MILFSIIMPVYNKANYVQKAIESILNQTYQGFELILINDGSTDESFDKINEYVSKIQNSGSKYNKKLKIFNQSNQGVSVTRNKGVEMAEFEYIAFLDADDWWETTYLEEMQILIENYPEAGIYGCSYFKVKHGKKIKANVGVDNFFESGYIDYFKVYEKTFYMPLWVGSAVIRKHVFISENGFKPFLKYGEDFDLWIRVALKNKVAFCNKHLSNYNQDVDYSFRAMDGKLHPVENEFLFHTGYLVEAEKNNPDLKKLLDKFKLYSLFNYYIQPKWHKIALTELNRVSMSNQSLRLTLKYKLPRIVVRYFYYLWGKIYLLKIK